MIERQRLYVQREHYEVKNEVGDFRLNIFEKFAVPKLSCVVNIPPYLPSYTTSVDLHNTIKINPAHFFMTLQYKTAMIKRYMCDKTVYKSSPKKCRTI